VRLVTSAGLVVAGVLAIAPPLPAQVPCPPRPTDHAHTTLFLPCQVDSPPVPTGALTVPLYPPTLLEAGIGGVALLKVPIDPHGRPDMSGMRNLVVSQPALTDAAVAAVRSWRFRPARLGGVAVRALASIVIHFVVPWDSATWKAPLPVLPELQGLRNDPDSGTVVTFGWPARDADAAPPTPREIAAARLLALQAMLTGLRGPGDGVPVACVGLSSVGGDSDVAPAQLKQLSVRGVTVMGRSQCLPTLGSVGGSPPPANSMLQTPPFKVLAGMVHTWRKGILLVDGSVGRGVGGTTYRCWVDVRGTDPAARCAASMDLKR
jgi:TonB family protein